MRRFFSIIIVLIVVLSGFGLMISFDFATQDAVAFTKVSGAISNDQTWNKFDGPFYVVGDITLSDANLTIDPDVLVSFNGSYRIIVSGGKLAAIGSESQPIVFDRSSGTPPAIIEILGDGEVILDWCVFKNASAAVSLINNQYKTTITNCTFEDSCVDYFSLTNSKVNVTSSRFNGKAFDEDGPILTNNLNKVEINDANSQLYIQYFVNVNTMDGWLNQMKDINVDVMGTRHNRFGKTDIYGRFYFSPITALKVNRTTPIANFFPYQTTISVSDKWDGTSKEITGISNNQTVINASSAAKDVNLYIPINFTFAYPPIIQTMLANVKVSEDVNKTIQFYIWDNDDFTPSFFNLTFNITDQNGKGIYGSNTRDKWISWSHDNEGQLYFHRTIESPFSPAPPNDYNAVVHEDIYITITDPLGLKDSIGPIDVEFTNVPDKPVINGLPWPINVTVVTEDVETNIPITVSDNDNATDDIPVYTSSKYVTYKYKSPSEQNLKLLYPNEFGENDKQEMVFINATDNCSDEVAYTFLVKFQQTPDPPEILGNIPNKWGNETAWKPDMSLGSYASDPDPDDDHTTLKWYVTGLNRKFNSKQVFTVSNENATANAPLSFNLNPDIDLGGAREPRQITDLINIWLTDKDGLKTHQEVTLFINSTNQQPSLHKLDHDGSKFTVIPKAGLTTDKYTFKIEYRDLDGVKGDAPDYVKVYIDGIGYEMKEEDWTDDDYHDGKVYYYETNLTAGLHHHYFECSDTSAITRLPSITPEPNYFEGPLVSEKLFIITRKSPDGNFIFRLAHMNPEVLVEVISVKRPLLELEPDKEEQNKTKGDIGAYFKLETHLLDSLLWAEVTVKFGTDYKNYNSTWLRKKDMQLGYHSTVGNTWFQLPQSQMDTNTRTLICNITPILSIEPLIDHMMNSSARPVFTVIGTLDADGDGYLNPRDAFPFDAAAREDLDGDGSPGKNEWCPGKSAKDSTTGLHEDKFPDDPAASIDNDNDDCPDEWNPGKTATDSTKGLTLDLFLNNPGACADTDLDGKPDVLIPERNTQTDLIEDTDDDNDGLPDWWEDEKRQDGIDKNLTHLFDPKDPSDAKADWDNDGRSNLEEYRDNTDPYKKDRLSEESDNLLAIFPIVILFAIVIGILVLFMYTKMRREDLLENKIRAEILEYINKNPGIHYRKILKDLDLQMGVLTHHLNMLEQQQYIKSLQDSMYRRFYSINAPINRKLILNEVQERILKMIHNRPGISQSEIARELGVARKVVNYHIKILSDAGFINVEPSGRESQCFYVGGLEAKLAAKS